MSLKNPSSTRFNSLKDDAAWRSKREVFDWPFGTGGFVSPGKIVSRIPCLPCELEKKV